MGFLSFLFLTNSNQVVHTNTFINSSKFVPYSLEYFISLTIVIAFGVFVISLAKKTDGQQQIRVLQILSIIISSSIISWAFIEMYLGRFYLDTDLPLIFCNLIGLFLPVYAFYRKQSLFNILYYLILAGAIQAIITPALKFSFPHYESIKFWTVHGGLVIFILYVMIVMKRAPTFKGIFHSFLFVQAYIVFVILINYMLDANYLFLWEKPKTASLLDVLGDWPYYIIAMDLLLIPYFLILYSPIWLIKRIKQKRQP